MVIVFVFNTISGSVDRERRLHCYLRAAKAPENMNKLLDAVSYMESREDMHGGEILYADQHGISEDVVCLAYLREKRDSKIFCCDDYGGLQGSSSVMVIDLPSCACTKDKDTNESEGVSASIRGLKKRANESVIGSNKRRCVRTDVFGKLRINESTSGNKYYYNGFEKILSDGTVEKYALGDRVYLLPTSAYEQMYIAQIESIFEECERIYVHCHWFERLGNNEVRLTNISDINSVECIEGKCIILQDKKGTNLYCKNNFANGWFYN